MHFLNWCKETRVKISSLPPLAFSGHRPLLTGDKMLPVTGALSWRVLPGLLNNDRNSRRAG